MWLEGAKAGLNQARHGGAELWGLWLGVLTCVQALYHIRKCVEMAKVNVPADIAERIDAHLEAFDAAVPCLKLVRDVIEHYEDGYALGKGNLQQPDLKPWERTMNVALSEQWAIVPEYADGDPLRPIVTVADGFVIDLTTAVDAAKTLLLSLWLDTRHL